MQHLKKNKIIYEFLNFHMEKSWLIDPRVNIPLNLKMNTCPGHLFDTHMWDWLIDPSLFIYVILQLVLLC